MKPGDRVNVRGGPKRFWGQEGEIVDIYPQLVNSVLVKGVYSGGEEWRETFHPLELSPVKAASKENTVDYTEQLVVDLVHGDILTDSQIERIKQILTKAYRCDSKTSFDQGVPTHCYLSHGHNSMHAGFSRNQLVRWN